MYITKKDYYGYLNGIKYIGIYNDESYVNSAVPYQTPYQTPHILQNAPSDKGLCWI